MMLITLAQARAQIRSDDTYDDALLSAYIAAVSNVIINYVDVSAYIDSTGEIPVDSNDMPDVDLPDEWNLACMIEVSSHYRFRENDADGNLMSGVVGGQFGYGYPLGRTSLGLLFPYRKPTAV